MDGRIAAQIPKSGDSGFTLLELLVVVAALALLSVGSTLAFGARGAAFPRDVARLEQEARQAAQLAITAQAPRLLAVAPEGLTQHAALLPEGEATRVRWESGRLRLAPNGRPVVSEALYLPSGEGGALRFSLLGRNGARADCAGDGWGGFSCEIR